MKAIDVIEENARMSRELNNRNFGFVLLILAVHAVAIWVVNWK